MEINLKSSEITKYLDAMKELSNICSKSNQINYKSFCRDKGIQGISISIMCDLGYLKKIKYGLYEWNSCYNVEPIMARRVIEKVKQYHSEWYKQKMSRMETKELVEKENVETVNPTKRKTQRVKKDKTEPQFFERTIKLFGIPIYSSIIRKI